MPFRSMSPGALEVLFAAAQSDHTRLVRALLLEAGAAMNQTDEDGMTALLVATVEGHADCVRLLLEMNADVDKAVDGGGTALMAASDLGHPACVHALLAGGASTDLASADGETALMLACAQGHAACVHALLGARAALNQAAIDGMTALHLACGEGQIECARALLAAGAAVNQVDLSGMDALMIASLQGHIDCVRALLDANAAVDQCKYSDGGNALTMASVSGHVDCARALLEAGADVHYKAKRHSDDSTTTYSALSIGRQHVDMIKLLCAYGAQREEVMMKGLASDSREWLLETTKGWTTQLHHVELLPAARVRALLVDGADVHASDGLSADSPTPLKLARAALARGSTAHEGAQLIVDAAAPWSPRNHALFPKAARARAVELLLLGRLLAREARFEGKSIALLDVWQHVLAFAVGRE